MTEQAPRSCGFTNPQLRETAARCVNFLLCLVCLTGCFAVSVFSQSKYEDRTIQNIGIVFEGADRSTASAAQFQLILRNALGDKYSAVKVRDALDALYRTEDVVSASVEAQENGGSGVDLRFFVKRKTRAEKILIVIGETDGKKVTEQELLLRLNLLNPGAAVTEQTLEANADLILEYLRDRGYFGAKVTFSQAPQRTATIVAVTFNVIPGTQAKVEKFNLNIAGFDAAKIADVSKKLNLKPGEPYSKQSLNTDVDTIKQALRKEDFLAPELDEPRIVYDGDKNTIAVMLDGKVGAKVNVTVAAERGKIGNKTQTKLLPIKREGTVDFAAIIEGERRLENYYQEQGYFFADVTPKCSVTPPFTEEEASSIINESESLCSALSGAELDKKNVEVKYDVNLSRQLKLVDIRLEGAENLQIGDLEKLGLTENASRDSKGYKLTIDDVQKVLESQKASVLGFIPLFGYGRGYTSNQILETDRATILSLMRELGYRNAKVSVRQGVSPNGEDLIITFVVDEGAPTLIADTEINGNKEISDATLQTKIRDLPGKNFSRARARNGVKALSIFYSNEGYYDAKVTYSLVELPKDAVNGDEKVKIVYNVENEGKKVVINRVLINGNEKTKSSAILKTVSLRQDKVLRAADIFSSEQSLYATSAFRQVEIKAQPAGESADGKTRLTDIIINVEEEKPRLITYGGGYSTDNGPFGNFDIRHYNLLGSLYQGGARLRIGGRQQLAQIDFVNPRFMNDGKNKDGILQFAPLTFSAQYQRDSTITRFFRSSFDRGTFGVVQRVDENNKPIDDFGVNTKNPTINRLTLSAETSRTISRKTRSLLFVRYRFEDVRLFNIDSLLIKDLLTPDARIRISGFGATFVRDTREDCSVKYTLLEIIAKGDPGEPCRYNSGDPTRGDYLTAEYNVSSPLLGANIGFSKLQATYNRFYTPKFSRRITFAGRAILGLATVFSRSQRFSTTQYPDLDGILPISERFFAGGSTTLRGFEAEGAGPRVVVVPQGIFRNSKGDQVSLDPFTIPFGGNALAIVNLETRVNLTKSIRAVPFYDGGNVFRRVGDIFRPPQVDPNDVFRQNLRAIWTHTVGLGVRFKTPVGGEFGADYGFLLNPPRFLIPQGTDPNAVYQLKKSQLHFRFSQAF